MDGGEQRSIQLNTSCNATLPTVSTPRSQEIETNWPYAYVRKFPQTATTARRTRETTERKR